MTSKPKCQDKPIELGSIAVTYPQPESANTFAFPFRLVPACSKIMPNKIDGVCGVCCSNKKLPIFNTKKEDKHNTIVAAMYFLGVSKNIYLFWNFTKL